MTEQLNAPELRFPEFKREWKEYQFQTHLSKIETGTNKLGSEDFLGLPLLKMGNIQRGNFSFNKLEKLKKDEVVNKEHLIQNKDFLFNTRNTMELVGKSATWRGESNKFAFNSNIARLTLENMDTVFFNYLYNTPKLIHKVKSLAVGTTSVAAIYPRDLKKLKYFIPIFDEQLKIGEFFSKLDRQIELEEKKLELLEQQKRGYMQKIFSQQLRFKDENGNEYPAWNKTLIKDIFIFENNRRKPITSSLREKGNYPYYGATGIIDYVKDYLFDNEERLLIGEDGAKWGQFETSSFIANGKYWVNNHAHVVKSNNHNLYFMNYYLNFKELRIFVTGNAPAKLTHANLCSMSIEMPIRNEQDKISHILKGIENRINKQNIKIQLLQQRKQGLLQKMFV
ncbi:restriction endonuclease subunit S [Staphylococcus chromogenes]|nr:restriction endonuclease subunit S [Staphylococcus chromogenes]MCE4961837.1 restriction endonuclease subunit S [Staphylococcus chromogenes]PTF95264.1 restriction endonuclease subunit S [Staphylococcus chromogenes]RIL98898.1 restriction endonuclease subunit S [Staphylococcus chromogenes]